MIYLNEYHRLRKDFRIKAISSNVFALSILMVVFFNIYYVANRFSNNMFWVATLLTVIFAVFLFKPFREFFESNFNNVDKLNNINIYYNYISSDNKKEENILSKDRVGFIIVFIVYIYISSILFSLSDNENNLYIILCLYLSFPIFIFLQSIRRTDELALSKVLTKINDDFSESDAKHFIKPILNHLNLVNKFLQALRVNKLNDVMLQTFIEFKTINITLKSELISRFLQADNLELFKKIKILGYFDVLGEPDINTYRFALDNYYETNNLELMFLVFKDIYERNKDLASKLAEEETDLSFKSILNSFILKLSLSENLDIKNKVLKI